MHSPLQAKPGESKQTHARKPLAPESGAGAGVPLFLQAKLAGNHASRCPACATAGTDGHKCPACEGAEEEKRGPAQPIAIQRHATDLRPDASPGVQRVLRSPGARLDRSTQRFFESRFGRPFDDIRVHADGAAQESAHAIKAHAYTAGKNLVFAAGQYAPHTEQGKRLLAHELTHTIQQGDNAAPSQTLRMHSAGMVIGHPNDPLEAEAEVAADRVLDGPLAPLNGHVAGGAVYLQAKLDPNAPVADFDVPDPNAPVVHPAEPPAPPPAASPRQPLEMTIDGYLLTNSPKDMREFVDDLTMRSGREAAYTLLNKLESGLPRRPKFDDPTVIFLRQLREVVDEAETEYKQFLGSFKWSAYHLTLDMLHESYLTVMREKQRYGLDKVSPFGAPEQGPVSSAATNEVSAAAKLLMIKKQELWNAWMEYEYPGGAHGLPDGDLQAAYQQYDAVTNQYNGLHEYLKMLYPILGRLGDLDQSFFHSSWNILKSEDALYKLAFGGPIRQFIVLRDEADQRDEDRIKTGEGLDEDPGRIWKLPPVIERTRRSMKVAEGSLNDKLIEGEIKRQKEEQFWTQIALGVIQLAGAVLAPFTGGLSLAVSVGIGISQARDSWEDYQFEKAAAGTDFDRARSLARSDPSLFGLAMTIVGVAFDVLGVGAELKGLAAAEKLAAQKVLLARAEQAFSELVPLVRQAESTPGKLAAETEQAILNAARKLDPTETLGESLVKQLKTGKEVGGEAIEKLTGLTGGQLQPLAESRAALRQSFESEELAADAIASAKNIHINSNGWIFVCHSPCTILREVYAELLAGDLGLYSRVERLEEKATRAAENLVNAEKTGNQTAKQAAQHEAYEVARDANILDSELRGLATARRVDALRDIENLRVLLEQSAVGPYAKRIVRELDTSAMERIMAAAAGKDPMNAIRGQLFEEIMNLKIREVRAASNLPLEFIPGWAIRGPNGKQLTDGIVGMWVNGRFKILTVYEAKASGGAAKSLLGRSTGYIKPARRQSLFELAKEKGFGNHLTQEYELVEENRQYAEVLRGAAVKVRVTRRARISLHETVKQFPDEVKEIAENTSQVEAGQLRSTAERLMSTKEISAYGQNIPIDFSANAARFEGVVPANVTAAEMKSLKQGAEDIGFGEPAASVRGDAIYFPTASFSQLGITEDEVRAMAQRIAAARNPAAVVP